LREKKKKKKKKHIFFFTLSLVSPHRKMPRRAPQPSAASPELVLTNCMMLADRAQLAIRNLLVCSQIAAAAARLVVIMEAAVELLRSSRHQDAPSFLEGPIKEVVKYVDGGRWW
jgi:rRNA maturation protein Rpf1